MKVQLINKPTYPSATIQVLHNRGVKDVQGYLNATMESVNSPLALGEEVLHAGARMLMTHVAAEDDILVVIDADCDGLTSSSVLINYLHDCFPYYVENHVQWYLHDGKQHGLSDCYEFAKEFKMVILPDSSSNDFDEHYFLNHEGIDVLVLDHHEADHISSDAVIINNQLSDYPNKELSGVGVVWQFCRYLDMLGGNDYANSYLDLVALGNMADMMSLCSVETKTLIFEGFKERNIQNPFIYSMAEKNDFSLNKPDYKPSNNNGLKITPMGAAFFIAPFVNAMVRSGTLEEKELVFESMLYFKAFNPILSNKRGHKQGEMERVIDQAIRTCTNVKNRQTRAEEAGMEKLETLIKERNLLDHKVLLFLLEPNEVDKNIAGLIANKIANKYQRPTAVLMKREHEYEGGEVEYSTKAVFPILHCKGEKYYTYEGSARGYGDLNFKDICAGAPGCLYAEGHQGAFGLGLREDKINEYLKHTDEILKDLSSEPSYFVDYIWNYDEIDGNKVIEIANMNDYWGKDLTRSYVYITNIPVNENTFKVMKSNTLKYDCPGVSIIQFGGTEDEIEQFSTHPCKINAVCKCVINEWNYQLNPQLMLEDYEIVKEQPSIISKWGF